MTSSSSHSRSGSASSAASRTPRGSRFFTTLHVRLYRLTGGLLGGRLGPAHILLLTTTGRKTGQPRTQPITYFRDDGELYLVASNWGNDRPPAWYLNLQTHPQAQIQIGRAIQQITATTATPEQRARLWPKAVAHMPRFARYQESTTREIPLVLLRPLAAHV